jgi:hypothetical protein
LGVSWTWAELNRAFCGDARAKWRLSKGGVTVRRQLHSTLRGMFVQPFSFVSYYFLELNLMISFLIFKRHIIAGWGRDTGMILRPTRISIRIYRWMQDCSMDPIEIGCTNSPTPRPRTCEWPVMSQPLVAPNRYQAPNLRSLWPYNNTQFISPKHMNDSRWIMNNSTKCSWTWDHIWLVRVRPLFDRMVPGSTNLLLLLQRRHCSSLIFICTNKIVMNIWILYYWILFLHISILYNFVCLIIFFFYYSIQFYINYSIQFYF